MVVLVLPVSPISAGGFRLVGLSEARDNSVTGGLRRAAPSRDPNRVLVTEDCADVVRRCLGPMLRRRVEKTGGDSFVDTLFEGLQEHRADEAFYEVDNHEPVEIGDLGKNPEAIKVVRSTFDRDTAPRRGGPGRGGWFDTSKR